MTFRANDLLTEQIAQYLEKRIILGELQPNERIQELRLAPELEVSRGSVREALLILQRRHLITILPRRGAIVTNISSQNAHDFFDLWITLLEKAVVHVAQNWQRKNNEEFSEIMEKLNAHQSENDLISFFESGIAFLRTLYHFVTNHYLSGVLLELLPLTKLYLYTILRAGHSQIHYAWQLLQTLMQAIATRNAMGARDVIRQFGTKYTQLVHISAETLCTSPKKAPLTATPHYV